MLIAFEGGEGAGKSLQAMRLRKRLLTKGMDTILLREPGSTPLGEHLRTYLKSHQPLCPKAEAMLFAAVPDASP